MSVEEIINIRGLKEAQAALAKLEPDPAKKVLQKATSAGAKVLKPYVVRETPVRTGKLRKSVSAGIASRERPSAIVKFRPKIAWYRHIVIDGAKPHRIRFPDQKAAGVPKAEGNIQHPGAKPNDILGRARSSGERPAIDAVGKVIDDYLRDL